MQDATKGPAATTHKKINNKLSIYNSLFQTTPP